MTAPDAPPREEPLADLACAAELELDADAVSFWDVVGTGGDPVLPEWYMPISPAGPARLWGWRRRVARVTVGLVTASFLAINAYGLCNTYGQLHL